MNKLNLYYFIIIIVLTTVFNSCKKDEGIGGTSEIVGKLVKIDYPDNNLTMIDTIVAAGEDVYIIYGENEFYNDDIETHFDGTFQFKYLNKGKYTVFAYSKDTLGSDIDIAIKKEVEIDKNNQTIDVGTIYIYDGLVGRSIIKGKILSLDYLTDYTHVIDTSTAIGEDVYISYENDEYYIDDVETNYDGTFLFNDLGKGDYTIYVYSNDPEGTGKEVAITQNISVTQANQVIDAGNIYIYKGLVGSSSITGKVLAVDYYDAEGLPKPVPRDSYYEAEEDVYIIYENNTTYFERTRTNYDGTYYFGELIPGTYTIYAYSKDTDEPSGITIASISVQISRANQEVSAETIIILK
ncbi:MAG: hypothetical protein JXB17_08760 [Bacteroidales bacterium]|nr:hypothetical protein [Bacteroidales bacterium]